MPSGSRVPKRETRGRTSFIDARRVPGLDGVQGENSAVTAVGISAFLCAAFAGLALYQLGGLTPGHLFEGACFVTNISCWWHLGLAVAQGAAACINTSKRQLFYE